MAFESELHEKTNKENNNQTSKDDTNVKNSNKERTLVEESFKKELSQMKLQNLGYPLGYLFSLYTFLVFFTVPLIIWKYGFLGFILTFPLRESVFYIDRKTSNATELNKVILNLNGFDPATHYDSHLKDNIIGLFTTIPLRVYFSSGVEAYFNMTLVINLLIMLAVNEVFFTIMHKLIHNKYPHIHKKHHCCIFPSITSNLVFHPIDRALEFTIPLLINYALGYLLNDWFCCLLIGCIVSAWYPMDHDEYIKLPHYKHHRYIDSNYNVYLNFSEYNPEDKVRSSVIREKTN